MPSFLITGAGRGLGLAFTEELLKNSNNIVIATARNTTNAAALQALANESTGGRIILLDMDVTNLESIKYAARTVETLLPEGLDHLISNAGISLQPLASFDELNLDQFKEEIDMNLLTPIHLIRAFLPLVQKSSSKKILVVSSQLGSIEIGFQMKNLCNAYAVAKAGLNMLVRKWSAVLKEENVIALLVHPGWISSTEIGSGITSWVDEHAPGAPSVSSSESAIACLKILERVSLEEAGMFYNYDGEKMPW